MPSLLRLTSKVGTGCWRYQNAWLGRSSNESSTGEYSSRTRHSVSMLKRTLGKFTTASGSATDLNSILNWGRTVDLDINPDCNISLPTMRKLQLDNYFFRKRTVFFRLY